MPTWLISVENARGKIQLLAKHEADSDIESDDERAVFNVAGNADDSDEEDYDDEEDDEEEEEEDDEDLDLETERAMRKLKMRKPFLDEDGILGKKP